MSTATAPLTRPFPASVLVASASRETRERIALRMVDRAHSIIEAEGGADALDKLETIRCKTLFVDDRLPDLATDDFIGLVESRYPDTEVFLIDRESGIPHIPTDLWDDARYRELAEALGATRPTQALNAPRRIATAEPLPGMVGNSPEMNQLYRHVRLVARRDTAVLVTGETGTGKELVAEAVHSLSSRARGPFVAVNCAAIPDTLLEAELFGYARGAFTGAVQSRIGKVHSAQGGTLFLDEVGEMPAGVQAKLLRFLENGEVQRLGTSDVFRVDVRIVAATNATLMEKVARKEFREDLLYRLAVFPVAAPPLRERGEDTLLLARHFLARLSNGRQQFTHDAEAALLSHTWPGNVRELRHVVERAMILADDGQYIFPEHIVILSGGALGCGNS